VISLDRKRILVDGTPRLLLSGEVHYFRVDRAEWPDRLTKLKDAGCDTVASYIPWLCHEDAVGGFVGLDELADFIDLAASYGLYFLARPGPFVMAELKNEGLPFRLYTEHPEIQPVTWDGAPVPTRTVDYLAPAYLAEVRRWYAAVLPVIRERLIGNGGNVIAVQLDNEVGMLSWVSNSPDLTDHVLADFAAWLGRRYGAAELAARYPFALDDPVARATGVRSPQEDYALALLHDLGLYMRDRFARYVATLKSYAEENGVTGVPFIVNIHGTADGRGGPFPIGISQLMETYSGVPGVVSGSDHYLGDLTTANAVDLYLINAFMDAVHDADQPLTSVEFEAGDGNYGSDLTHRHSPGTTSLKTRLCVAQGNRLLNYYLFAGGINPRLPMRVGDGNDRIAFTGERHGFAAPVGPEGQLNLTYAETRDVLRDLGSRAGSLATMNEEHDGLAMAFMPDYFMTESFYPDSVAMRDLVSALERHRFGGPGQMLARSMLLAGYRFGALDVQRRPLSPSTTPVLVLASARYLAADVQRKLVSYLRAGGRLLLCGEVPSFDLEGRSCTLLMDAFGLTQKEVRYGDHRFFLSVCASGWTAPRPEVRVSYAQLFEATPAGAELLVYDYDSGAGCGFDLRVGEGRAVVLTTDYPGGDIEFYRLLLEALGATAGLRHEPADAHVVVTSTANEAGERLLHVLNLDGRPQQLTFSEHGRPLFDGEPVELAPRQGVILPLS
jgi:beta-galactosidase